MKWYGILAFLVLIGGLAGIVIYGMNQPEPIIVDVDDVQPYNSIFNATKDITEIPGLEIIHVTPEMWEENQKRAEESNDIRLEQLKKLSNDTDFVKATKIIQELNSINIEDDVYWQTVLDSLILISEKQGISLNSTLSLVDSDMFRELMRQEKQRELEIRDSPMVIIIP